MGGELKEAGRTDGGAWARVGPLRASILAGIAYDWLAAALIAASPPPAFRVLGISLPCEPFHFRFAALLLVILPFFYLLAWRDPVRYSGVVGAMVVARLAGFLFLAGHVLLAGAAAAYAGFALADLAFAAVHVALARRAGLSRADLFPCA